MSEGGKCYEKIKDLEQDMENRDGERDIVGILIRIFKVALIKNVHLSKYLKEVRELAMWIIRRRILGRVPESTAFLASWGIVRKLVWLEWSEQREG